MDSAQVPAGSIVVGIDGSSWSDEALDWAIEQATLEQRTLVVAFAVERMSLASAGPYASSGLDYGLLLDENRDEARRRLTAAVAHAHDRQPQLSVHRVLSLSDPRSMLLELGERAAAIVVGSRGRGPVATLLLGSVSVSVSKHAACPVVVVRPSTVTSGHGILVGVDGTEGSLPALEFAYGLASFRGLPLTVLHSYPSDRSVAVPVPGAPEPDLSDERALVSESLAGMGEKFPEVDVTVHLEPGLAEHQLIKASPGYDVVVVGHHRTTLLVDLVYDSVAPVVLEHARGTVAVVPCLPPVTTADGR